MESLPLFIAATLSGVFAEKLTRTDVGNAQFSAIFLAIRVLYTLLYVSGILFESSRAFCTYSDAQINTSSEQASHARSMTWTAGLALCFYQIYKAAVALA